LILGQALDQSWQSSITTKKLIGIGVLRRNSEGASAAATVVWKRTSEAVRHDAIPTGLKKNDPRPRFTQPTFVGLGLRSVSVVEAVEEGMEAARPDAYLGSGQFR
jgi:hypothetical protein